MRILMLFLINFAFADVDLVMRDMKKLESMYRPQQVIQDSVKKKSSSVKKRRKRRKKLKFTDLESYFKRF